MMRVVIRSNLKTVLEAQGIKGIDLVRAVRTRYGAAAISQPTVYAVAKGNGLPDERTADQLLHALRDLTGQHYGLGDIFEWQPDAPAPEERP